MLRRALAIACSLWLAGPALAQNAPGSGGPMSPVVGSVSPTGSLTFTPASVFNAQDPQYAGGAKCDGTSDVGPAINAAVQAIRNQSAASGNSWAIGVNGRLVVPSGKCVIITPLNFTSVPNVGGQPNTLLYGAGFVADLWGAQFICKTNGQPCVDATGLGQASILGLNIYGSCVVGEKPNIGLMLSRLTAVTSTGADSNKIIAPTATGCYTLTPYYNRSSETTSVDHAFFLNYTNSAYAAIWDGSNYFNVQSVYSGTTYTPNTFSSFNENTCYSCLFEVIGTGSTPLWIGGTSRHSFIGGYAYAPNSGGGAGVILSSNNGVNNDYLDLGIHFEDTSLGSIIKVTGAATPTINALSVSDFNPQQSGPLFKRDSGVTSVTLNGANLNFGVMTGTSPSWWDTASAWTVSGTVFNKDSTFSLPNSFSGGYCVAGTCTQSGAFSALSGTTIFATTITGTTINTSTVSNPGSVQAFTIGTPVGNQASVWLNSTLNGSLPTIAATPSNGAGGGGTGALASIVLYGTPSVSGGVGCTVGDTFNLTDTQSGGGLVSAGQPYFTATTVSSGAVTATSYTASSGNPYLWNKPMSGLTTLSARTSTCSTLPTLNNVGTSWSYSNGPGTLKATISVTAMGSGYTAPPTVTFSPAFTNVAAGGTTVTAALNSTMSMASGNGQVVFGSSGTQLGIAGVAGYPVLSQGATVDATCGTAVVLTTSGDTVSANSSCRRYKPTGTVATATITLPTAFADGQLLSLDLYAFGVTALTFSPAVTGWTNASALAANTALRLRWDATGAVWFREQ